LPPLRFPIFFPGFPEMLGTEILNHALPIQRRSPFTPFHWQLVVKRVLSTDSSHRWTPPCGSRYSGLSRYFFTRHRRLPCRRRKFLFWLFPPSSPFAGYRSGAEIPPSFLLFPGSHCFQGPKTVPPSVVFRLRVPLKCAFFFLPALERASNLARPLGSLLFNKFRMVRQIPPPLKGGG